MLIDSIDLKNIGKWATFAMGFKPGINIITGPNDSGKSSLKNSILFGLSGTASNKSKFDLCTTGIVNSKSEITLYLNSNNISHCIKRVLSPDPSVMFDGIKKIIGKAKAIDALADVGYDRNTFRMICDNYNFFSLSSEEQQTILFKYFTGIVPIDVSKYGVTNDLEKSLFFGMTSANIPLYYKKFYDGRRDLHKEIEMIEINKSHKANEILALNVNYSMQDLERQRQELTAKVQSNVYSNQYSEALKECENDLIEIMKRNYVSTREVKLKEINIRGSENANTIKKIQESKGNCPLSKDTKCESFNSLETVMNALIETNNKLRAEAITLIDLDNKEKFEFNTRKQEKIDDLNARIASIKEMMNNERRDNDDKNRAIAAANESVFNEIRAIDEKIKLYKRRNELEEGIKNDETELKNKKEKLANYEIYLELTGDGEKSIKNKMVSGNIGDFFRMVTENAREFGYEFAQNASKSEFEVLINGKTSKMLSSSGEIKASLAIQVAISKVSGYNIVMADDVEKCEQGNLMKIIDALQESGVQAFLFGHNLNKAIFPSTVNFIELA